MSLIVGALLFAKHLAAEPSIDPKLAERYFQEAKWSSDDDAGGLWGRPLYGPMMFIDPQTRFATANQADAEGKLTKSGNVWVGTVPPEMGVANTALTYLGTKWTTVMWPLPGPQAVRIMLMMHECFHRIQDDAGLPPPAQRLTNAHLDTKDGRIWLRMEYRALSKALPAWGKERDESIRDALIFRAYRQSLFPGSKAQEDRLEAHEGLAEYTGVRRMGLGQSGARYYLAARIKVNALKPSYPFSFAYETGPAYGLLLEMTDEKWTKKVKPESSLADLVRGANKIAFPSDLAATAKVRMSAYDGREVIAEELAREEKRVADEKMYRASLVDGPVLELPLPSRNYTYDPNAVFPLGSNGTVYPESHIADGWGVLEVTKGVLVAPSQFVIYVAAPKSADIREANGWKLTLNPGWRLVPGGRKGDYKVVKS